MTDAEPVLTVPEVASYLRAEPDDVLALLEGGKLIGFKIAGEWRVPSLALTQFMEQQMRDTQLEVLERLLRNPDTWIEHGLDREWLEANCTDAEPGSFGAWLLAAARAKELERDADNVVKLEPRRDE